MGRGRVIVMVQSTYGLPTRPLRVASPTIPNENFNDYRLASENGRPMEPTPEMKSLIIMTIPGPSIKHRSVSAVGHEKYSKGGKTSMLNVMGTIDKPTKGHVKVCDTVVSTKTKDADIAFLRLKRIGFCFQTFNLISSMSAVENVELPMVLAGEMNRTQIRKRAKELLQTVGLGERIYHRPSQMSGGEQQRVTLCRAVSNNPDLILLDEPTGDLDTMNSNIILKLLVELNVNQRITMVMVTHDISLKYLAHRVVHMLDGKIHKIERISAEEREHAVRELHDQVELNKIAAEIKPAETEVRDPFSHYDYQKFLRTFDRKLAVDVDGDEC
eukprot:346330_1